MSKKVKEAGRTISKANEGKLRSALKAIADVLSILNDDDDSKESKEARRKLAEAANLGNWLEARLHLSFTEMADHMFGEGRLTREERIALSSAIGAGLQAFNAEIAANVPHLYQRSPWDEATDGEADISEGDSAHTMSVPDHDHGFTPRHKPLREAALNGEFMRLVEKAVSDDGTAMFKVIEPGWGSSGYYPADVLERDGPKVFRAQTKSFWNHMTAREEVERPEGDLRDLAAELVEDAQYMAHHPEGPGLYARAKVFAPYQEAVNELAPHIGVSIRARGRVERGTVEGKTGDIVQELIDAQSVDFVTEPGAGGRIVQMFEAARGAPHTQEDSGVNEKEFKEAQERLQRLEQENGRLREAMLLREAREQVQARLATVDLPDVTRRRLAESLSHNPPITEAGELDGAALETRVDESVNAEREYLQKATGYGSGRVTGMGGSAPAPEYDAEKVQTQLQTGFERLGLNEAAAKAAAAGRN